MAYTAEEAMLRGRGAFRDHQNELAGQWFNIARGVLRKLHGKYSSECVPAYYMYGLTMLYESPIKFDKDPMNLVPMEVDYHSDSARKPDVEEIFPGKRIEQSDDTEMIEGREHVEHAWKELYYAWNILKKTPGNSMEKVDILSALGEVAYRKGQLYPDLYYPENYYREALTILENLVEPDNQRIAHLNFKMSVCLEETSKTEAIAYCKKAISVCQTRLKRLIAETSSSSGTAATLTVPDLNQEQPAEPLVQKKDERSTLIKLTSEFLFQLDALKNSVASNPTPTSSQLKRLIAEATSSSGTAATLTVPDLNQEQPAEPLVQEKDERSTLTKLISEFLFQLDALKNSVTSNPTPTSSQLKRLIAEATSSSETAATLTVPDLNQEPTAEPSEDPSLDI